MAWPALDPGRLLERCGDVAPRRMTVHDRTRLTGRLRHLRSGVRPSRRCPRFVPPVAVQTAGPAPGIPNPCGCSLPSSGVRPKKTPTLRTAGGGTNRGPRSGHATPLRLSLPSSGVRPKKTPTLHTAGGGTNRGPRSGHATPPRLSPRPLDSRGLALGCTAGASGRPPSMELLSMELLGNDCCFLLRLAEGNGGSRPFCLPPLAGEGARRADGGSAGMRGGSHPHPALGPPFSRRREKGGLGDLHLPGLRERCVGQALCFLPHRPATQCRCL
ncbi:hypothetical protein CPBF426_34470 [Xanthomonas arboricola pv. juglandis]|nr:hypothetical protein CPBF426_34470 [Xanthomonas arboricola pv. juglandis]